MALPQLNPHAPRSSIVLAQKEIHQGVLFSAIHRGSSIIALDQRFALKFTKASQGKLIMDLVEYGINAKSYTNVNFAPKKATIPKVTAPPKSKRVFKKQEGVEDI